MTSSIPSLEFQTKVNETYLLSHHQQLHVQRIIGDRSWSLSVTDPSHPHYGKLVLDNNDNNNNDVGYSIQLIGTAMEQSWQWGWANDLLSPPDLVQGVIAAKHSLHNIPEFQVPKFALPHSDMSWQLASVACTHMPGAHALFTAPTGTGMLFVAICDEEFPPLVVRDAPSLIRDTLTVVTETDAVTDIPLAIHSFLTSLGAIQLLKQQNACTYAFPALAVGSIHVTWDASGRHLQSMTTTTT
ncbi:expressed unknown protein [Seminavis robusta]|uniref:Uncharacterized protein n=1 Tax=Seminavis robusta TaxID=568900 RepID=A0A9N8EKX1_9STRA|nr:expressed unknown protein [Seminavis robusta]|eukprot:Sro1361_g266170.1 n/a (242) ;mRNA; r:4477-5202